MTGISERIDTASERAGPGSLAVPRRGVVALLILFATPLLLAVSCLETQPPLFDTHPGVLRDEWAGVIRISEEEVLEFRLLNVEAEQTGPDSYRFEGDAYFELNPVPGRILGTSTVEPAFEPSRAGNFGPQMQPPMPPSYQMTATLSEPEGGSEWQLVATTKYRFAQAYIGTAKDPAGQQFPVELQLLGSSPHVMGLATVPAELLAGESFEVVWNGWAEEGQTVRCRVSSTAKETIEPSDCTGGITRVTLQVPVIEPPLTEPAELGITLAMEWGSGRISRGSWRIRPMVIPTPKAGP